MLALTLGRLTRLERGKIDAEYEEVIKTIAYLESILASDQKVRLLIKDEMDDLAKKYGDDRRTEITDQEATELSAEDLVPKEDVVVTLTHRGYVKRQPLRVFRAQKRGGVGLKGAQADRRQRRAERHARRGLRAAPADHAHARVDALLHAERPRLPAARPRGAGA